MTFFSQFRLLKPQKGGKLQGNFGLECDAQSIREGFPLTDFRYLSV